MIIIIKHTIDILFTLGLLVGATLMIPQIIKIILVKNSKDFSLISYVGFNIFQLGMALHGYFKHDYILMVGSFACFLLNSITIILIFTYREKTTINRP